MSIRQRKSKKSASGFTYQVYFSYVDIYTNERKNYSKSGFLSYEDAVLFEKKKKIELVNNENLVMRYKITLDEVFQEWLILEAEYLYQANTIIDYKNRYYKHIKGKLGNIKVNELDFIKLQTFFNNNQDIGLPTNYKIKEVLNVIMRFSIKCGYIIQNPLSLVHVVGSQDAKQNNNKVYSDDEFMIIVDELLKHPSYIRYSYVIALYVGKYTGLRISEVFALDRNDFLFNVKQINVSKKMVYASKKRNEIYVCNQMKTNSSQAILPLHKDLEDIINQWFAFHHHQHIISDKDGNYLNPKQLEYTLWKISKEKI